jgi:hypothetical protein
MFTDIAKHLLDAIKLSPRYLVAISFVLGFALFAPAELAQKFGVDGLAKDYRTGMGVGLLLCLALLAVGGGQWIYEAIRKPLRTRRFKRDLHQRLCRLTEDEKQILRYYMVKQTRANTLRYDDGVVQGLAGSKVIFQAATMGNLVEGFAYAINEIAWDMLNKEPALLDGSTNTYRTDKRDYRW